MKQFKTVLIMVFMITIDTQFAFAKSSEIKPLKAHEGKRLVSLSKAKLSDVHLAKTVKYFDIKRYDASGKYVTGWSFDRAAYNKLSDRDKIKIRSVRGKKPKGSFWIYSFNDGAMKGFYNLHYLDNHSKVHTINSRRQLLSFLGTIDTPAELSMLFRGTLSTVRYKKIGDIYNIRINSIHRSDCDGCGEPACTIYVQQLIMNNRGKILSNKKVSEKSFMNEKNCKVD